MNQLSVPWFIWISCPCYDLYESVVCAMIYMNQLSMLWFKWISYPCYDLYESVVRAMIYMNQLSVLFSNILGKEIPTLNDNSFFYDFLKQNKLISWPQTLYIKIVPLNNIIKHTCAETFRGHMQELLFLVVGEHFEGWKCPQVLVHTQGGLPGLIG